MSRPPLKPEDRRSKRIRCYLTEAELEQLDRWCVENDCVDGAGKPHRSAALRAGLREIEALPVLPWSTPASTVVVDTDRAHIVRHPAWEEGFAKLCADGLQPGWGWMVVDGVWCQWNNGMHPEGVRAHWLINHGEGELGKLSGVYENADATRKAVIAKLERVARPSVAPNGEPR